MNKRSYSETIFLLERLRAAGLVEWQPKARRTLRPRKMGGQMLTVAPLYVVGETVRLPFEKWPQRDALWLDPKLLKLDPLRKHIVLEAGNTWRPALLGISAGGRVVVARPDEAVLLDGVKTGAPIVVHLGEKVVVASLGYERGWFADSPNCRVTNKNLIGIVAAVVSFHGGSV